MRKAHVLPIALIAFAIVGFLFVLDYSMNSEGKLPWSTKNETRAKNTNVACTMEAKLCPDGSAVGRTGPNCAFAECPATKTTSMSDWKTYTNTDFGYSIKYPPTWTALTEDNFIQIAPPETVTKNFAEGSIRLIIEKMTSIPTDLVTGSRTVTINGQRATQQTEGGLGVYTATYFPYGKEFIQVSFDQDVVKPEFEQILSTFTFTTSTADWKTYKNSIFGYTVQYPGDWDKKESNTGVTFSSKSETGHPFSTPMLTITTKKDLYPKDFCLLNESTVIIGGISSTRQTEGCGYAGSVVATFIPKNNTNIYVSWTEDVPSSYPIYNQILSSFTFTQ